jgi:hypothetical protein
MVEFIGLSTADDPAEMCSVLKGAIVQEQLLAHDFGVCNEVANITAAHGVWPMNQAVNDVVLGNEEVSEVRSILAGDSGNKSNRHIIKK